MISWLNEALQNDIVKLVLSVLINVVIANALVQRYKHKLDKKVEMLKYENARNLQVDNFFKSINEKEIKDTLDVWSDMLMNVQNFAEKATAANVAEMLKNVFIYGSDSTIKIASVYQQYSYSLDEDKQSNDEKLILVVLAAEVICSLKYDFTGYKVEPMDLIKMKLNDAYKIDILEALKKARKSAHTIIVEGVTEEP
ncbi:TPA_asm: hypothetical protein GZN65_10460 [Listeria monocytogenes]|nr:hypothetical protein [Listeria monocytogenes]HAC3601158.1 hypothetical protein [Listeria monocytogenes]